MKSVWPLLLAAWLLATLSTAGAIWPAGKIRA